ncbi:hypothetical protein ASD55_00305 [Rhodanobacter sp. Root561]|uniref:hypothetical protein n=1 Tax=Rhodanobacter sp. Root561 TaxID=1736560 RepID=UPI0006F1F4DB|nr:hypothetical protein [Rhodanobacter sp. Root561]KQZ79200.1 hypothetical protein ASD55_00305 [Rhodanobacter sp. Root561]
MAVSAPLARALAAGRSRFNARAAEVRHRHPGFDDAAFAGFVGSALDRVVQAVDAVAPERVHAVAIAGYDMALDLVAQGLAGPGARQPWVDQVWLELAPRHAGLLAAQPQAVLGALGNAVIQLGQWPQVRVADWLQWMTALAGEVAELTQLRALGQLLAWRAGMAHYRRGALTAANILPPALALAALDADPASDWPALRDALLADPWHGAQQVPTSGVQIGAFSGFGGHFAQPPELRAADEGFMVRSADRHRLLLADRHGAVLLPASAAEFEAASTSQVTAPLQHVAALGWPRDSLLAVADAHTLALSSPCTHAIALFPRP